MFTQPVENKGQYSTLEDVLCSVEKRLGFREVPANWVDCLTGEYYALAHNIQETTNLQSWEIVSAFLNGWYQQIKRMHHSDSVCKESMQLAIRGMVNEPYPTDDGTSNIIATNLSEMLIRKYRNSTPKNIFASSSKVIDWKKHIDHIMKNFDFERVHDIMDHLKWKWCIMPGGKADVPNVEQLKREARRQLEYAIECGDWVSSGGFQVIIEPASGYLSLKFIVEESEFYEGD